VREVSRQNLSFSKAVNQHAMLSHVENISIDSVDEGLHVDGIRCGLFEVLDIAACDSLLWVFVKEIIVQLRLTTRSQKCY
jgi:hypothetical protein